MLLLLPYVVSRADSADDTKPADIEIRFVPQASFPTYVAECVPGNIGFFRVNWNGAGEIIRATVLIATDTTSQIERIHTIREEITQSLGLMRDSYRYTDSIFYQGWSAVTRFTSLDEAVVRILYRPELRPNMTREQAVKALQGLFSSDQIEYFAEIAFGSEYAQSDTLLHRWTRSPTIQVFGTVTEADVRTVHQCVREINRLTGPTQLRITNWSVKSRKA